jgi:hypothetical protein
MWHKIWLVSIIFLFTCSNDEDKDQPLDEISRAMMSVEWEDGPILDPLANSDCLPGSETDSWRQIGPDIIDDFSSEWLGDTLIFNHLYAAVPCNEDITMTLRWANNEDSKEPQDNELYLIYFRENAPDWENATCYCRKNLQFMVPDIAHYPNYAIIYERFDGRLLYKKGIYNGSQPEDKFPLTFFNNAIHINNAPYITFTMIAKDELTSPVKWTAEMANNWIVLPVNSGILNPGQNVSFDIYVDPYTLPSIDDAGKRIDTNNDGKVDYTLSSGEFLTYMTIHALEPYSLERIIPVIFKEVTIDYSDSLTISSCDLTITPTYLVFNPQQLKGNVSLIYSNEEDNLYWEIENDISSGLFITPTSGVLSSNNPIADILVEVDSTWYKQLQLLGPDDPVDSLLYFSGFNIKTKCEYASVISIAVFLDFQYGWMPF